MTGGLRGLTPSGGTANLNGPESSEGTTVAKTLQELLVANEAVVTDRYIQLMRASSPHYATTPAEEIAPNIHRSLQLIGGLAGKEPSPEARAYIRSLCEQRVPRGFRLSEVMAAIFLLGDVVIPMVRDAFAGDLDGEHQAIDQLRSATNHLALLWSDGYYELQEEIMERKELAMRQLSTPVTQVWDGILTLPLIGDVDDRRSRQITEDLLANIIETQSDLVLLDITGIGSINTSVIAQMLRTIRASELLGARCWVVGVSPEIAHTIVNLGVDLQSITTYANLREGLAAAFERLGLRVVKRG